MGTILTVPIDSVAAMTAHRSEFRLTRPGALIAALPAVLGFVPEKSLVLVSIERGDLGAVMRADLSDELPDNLAHLARVAAASGTDRVIAVIVDAEGALCPTCNDDHRVLCEELATARERHEVGLCAAPGVDRGAARGRGRRDDGCGADGVVDDPSASPLAAAAVLDGRRLYPRRTDLQALIAVGDPKRAAALAATIDEYLDRMRTGQGDSGDDVVRRGIETAMAAAARISAGSGIDDRAAASVAGPPTAIEGRDTLHALAVGECAGEAEMLWATLARALPDRWRIEPLVLLAFSAYARGDGPLAGLSLEAALRIDPQHRMAGMLDTALQSGLRPEEIRRLAGTGYRLAKVHGVRLPPQRAFGRRIV